MSTKPLPWAIYTVVGQELEVWPGQVYQVQTRQFSIGRGVVDSAGEVAARELTPGPILLVDDPTTRTIAGEVAARSFRAAGFDVHHLTLTTHHHRLEATSEEVSRVQSAAAEIPGLVGMVAVGAGTLNDLAKLASFRLGLPYAVVATAASMNGYTSAIAAILDQGVKRTIPCAPPAVVIADLDIVAAAPRELTLSGLGDLLSKPVSSGDWRLSHLLMGENFSEVPIQLVEVAFKRVREAADGIGKGEPEAVGALLDALLLSGISMASAGSSSPASGGEHLISHYWDMTAPYRGREVGLHGAQVGVATLVSACLYQFLRETPLSREDLLRRVATLPTVEAYIPALQACPEELRGSIEVEVRKKYPTPVELSRRLEIIDTGWERFWEDIGQYVENPVVLREVLERAGAPVTVKQLGIPAWEMREAYHRARDIRARYTVLDLAWELTRLDQGAEEVLGRARVLT